MRVLVIVILLLPTLAFGSENCVSMNGICRDLCGQDEAPLDGAFIDCGEKQECCAAKIGSSKTDRQAGKEAAPKTETPLDKDAR